MITKELRQAMIEKANAIIEENQFIAEELIVDGIIDLLDETAAFDKLSAPTALDLIAAERERHVTVEGWTKEGDAQHVNGELARAAAAYAIPYEYHSERRQLWPKNWDRQMWKPTPENRIKELVKAGALIAAEIDRLNNLEQKEVKNDPAN